MRNIRSKAYAGFSMLELMIVVAILGVIATVAVPRFNIFRTRARQAEARNNVGVIFTLQESFNINHGRYYNGESSNWGGTNMHNHANRDGYLGGSNYACSAALANNALGFRMANCEKSRYGYFILDAGEDHYMAIAYAPSDSTGEKRIFPGCNGSGAARAPGAANPTGIKEKCFKRPGTNNISYTDGDAWCVDESRNIENFRDITEFCDG